MKHLRKFNEDSESQLNLLREDLRDFCEMYLAYLIDEGFELDISAFKASDSWSSVGDKTLKHLGHPTDYFRVTLEKYDNSVFLWEDVVDHLIPFFKVLKDNYNILKVEPSSTVPSIKKAEINMEFSTRHNIKYMIKELGF